MSIGNRAFIAVFLYLFYGFFTPLSADPASANITISPAHVYADGIQQAAVLVTDIRDENGLPVPDGTRMTLVVLSSNRGAIEGGTVNPFYPAAYRDFVISNNSIVATYRSPDLALGTGQTVPVTIRLYPLLPDGRPDIYSSPTATGNLTLIGKGSAQVTVSPDHIYADGIQTSTILITDILDALGNPVPDGEICTLVVQSSNRGTIEGGSPNPFNSSFQDFEIQQNSIVATYRSPDLALGTGQTVPVTIMLYPLDPYGRPQTYTGPAATGHLTLTGKGSASVSVSPDHVYADGIQTSTILITDIVDALGYPVPDGEICALVVQSSNRGSIEGGSPNPFNSNFEDFEIRQNSIVATYRSSDLGLSAGQTVPVTIMLYPLDPYGRPQTYSGPTATGRLTLIGKGSADVSASPDVLFADGIQTSTIRITDIVDSLGNPVPDGEICTLAVQSSNRGTIEGGSPNLFYPTVFRDFEIVNNEIVATYRSADLALGTGQTIPVTINLYPLEPDGRPRTFRGPTATGHLTLTGKGSAVVTASPDEVLADGIQTSTITITDILDSLGNPVPDGEICTLAVQSSNRGTIEDGTPNPFYPTYYRDFEIDDNTIVATYRSPDLPLSPGQSVPVTIRLYPLDPNGRPRTYPGPTATGSLTLVGIQDRDSDSIPDDEDNCPDTYNPLQEDLDGDGIGDVCDPDDDGDQVPDVFDNCPIDANPGQEDYDIDGIGNACDDVFSADGIVADLEALNHQITDLIVSVDPPGGKGMIAKLTGNGGVLSKASQALYGFADGSIDIATYVEELDEALDMLDAFDNQLAAKRSTGQIPDAQGEALEELSGLVRALIELLQAAVGG